LKLEEYGGVGWLIGLTKLMGLKGWTSGCSRFLKPEVFCANVFALIHLFSFFCSALFDVDSASCLLLLCCNLLLVSCCTVCLGRPGDHVYVVKELYMPGSLWQRKSVAWCKLRIAARAFQILGIS